MTFQANCLPTGIGSVPNTDPQEACNFVASNFPQIPFWPQLPRHSFGENMYAQYSEGLPGLQLEEEKIYLDKNKAYQELERFYERFLSGDLSSFAISSEYSSSWKYFIAMAQKNPNVRALKGHVTGPISFGLQVTDEKKRAIIYDDNLRDVVIKQITRKAQWQERELKKLCQNVIVFIDEPYLSSFGSAFVNLGREEVIAALDEVFSSLNCLSAVHCCGNTDWSLLLNTQVKILNLDAFSFTEALLLYKNDLKYFLKRNGIIAWGIIPTEVSKIVSLEDLQNRFESTLTQISQATDTSLDTLLRQSLITPACGVGSNSMEHAIKIFQTTAALSNLIREKYKLV